MKKTLILLLSVSLLCGLISGCSQSGSKTGLSAPSNVNTLSPDYVQIAATRGDIQKTITGTSSYRSVDAATAYFTISGTISNFNVVWGSEVKAGDVIAILAESADYNVELAKAKQALEIAEIQLNQAKSEAEGGGEVALAQLKWQQAQNNYETSNGKDEQLRLDSEMLKATYENLSLLAKNNYSELLHHYGITKTIYDTAQAKYDACFLKAPIGGVITWINRNGSEGSHVRAFGQMVTIESKKNLVHVFAGSSSDSQYLTIGDIITVVTRKSNMQYRGRILFTPDKLPGDINYNFGGNANTPIYMIELLDFDYTQVNVTDTGEELILILQDHRDVVLIDTYLLKTAVTDDELSYYVNVLYNHVPIKRPVTIGIKNGDFTEVTYGLKEGESVIYFPRAQ